MSEISDLFLQTMKDKFTEVMNLGRSALDQVQSDEHFSWLADAESNSIAILVHHLSNNMKSRWTNWLTDDGEKPDRNRAAEFRREQQYSKQQILEMWDRGWHYLLTGLAEATADELTNDIIIRGQAVNVVKAIQTQFQHAAYHVGQIVFLVKHIENDRWENLSVPRDK